MTSIVLDSFLVYALVPQCGLSDVAAIRGFQAALGQLAKVIVAEMRGFGDESSALATAADAAFDAGAVVIAANGNFGPDPGTVRAPANAHKVLGVGAYDVVTQATLTSQGRGPTTDGRMALPAR